MTRRQQRNLIILLATLLLVVGAVLNIAMLDHYHHTEQCVRPDPNTLVCGTPAGTRPTP